MQGGVGWGGAGWVGQSPLGALGGVGEGTDKPAGEHMADVYVAAQGGGGACPLRSSKYKLPAYFVSGFIRCSFMLQRPPRASHPLISTHPPARRSSCAAARCWRRTSSYTRAKPPPHAATPPHRAPCPRTHPPAGQAVPPHAAGAALPHPSGGDAPAAQPARARHVWHGHRAHQPGGSPILARCWMVLLPLLLGWWWRLLLLLWWWRDV